LIAGPLIERMRYDAERLKLSFRVLARRPAVDAVLAGKINVVLGLFWNLPDTIERTTLWQGCYCVVGGSERWSSHERTMDGYLAGRHLLISLDGGFDGVIDTALAEIGRDLQGSNDSDLVLALRRGCGRMEDLAPENDFKRG
jgi:hypothetical protein